MNDKGSQKIIEIEWENIPSVNDYWHYTYKNGKPHVFITRQGQEFKTFVNYIAKNSIECISTNELHLEIKCYFKRYNRDIDNVLKPLLDSLQGVVYENDSQIKSIYITKFKSDKNKITVLVKG